MENPNENLSKAHLCVHGHLAEGLMTPHVCAMCWARPGRMGCILHGHTGLASLDHSDEPQNGAASPETKAYAAEFVASRKRVEKPGELDEETKYRRGLALQLVAYHKSGAPTARGWARRFRSTCEAHHEALHAVLMPYQEMWLAGDEEAERAEIERCAKEIEARREERQGMAAAMACDYAATCAGRVWRKRDEPEEVPTSCDHALSCVMRSCSSALLPEDLAQVEAAARDWQGMTPEQRDSLLADSLAACRAAAMPEDVAARIGKRMRREQKRQLRRICVLAFLRGMGKGAMLVFRVLWMAAVMAAAIALGIGLVVLFLTGVLWLIY